jgi:hypothetical protein
VWLLCLCPHILTPPSHTLQVIGLKTGQTSQRLTVVGTGSSAEVIVPDVNAGCPAIIHVIDAVLLPALPELEVVEVVPEGTAMTGASAIAMARAVVADD